jgi:hypothetical protein
MFVVMPRVGIFEIGLGVNGFVVVIVLERIDMIGGSDGGFPDFISKY